MASTRGMIAVDKMGTKVLFINPVTYQTEVVLDGFEKTVHELLVIPETEPRLCADLRRRHPRPQSQSAAHRFACSTWRSARSFDTIDLRPYIAPHTLKLGPDGLIYITCENSAAVVAIDRKTNTVVGAIDSGSTNGHRLIIAPDGQRLYTENEEDAHRLGDRSAEPEAARQDQDAPPARRHRHLARRPHRGGGRRRGADAVPDRHRSGRGPPGGAAEGCAEGRADRPLCARQQPDRRHQPEQRHGEPDRSLVPRADRDQGRQPADGHGVPGRRIVRALPGRRHGACHRYSEPAAQARASPPARAASWWGSFEAQAEPQNEPRPISHDRSQAWLVAAAWMLGMASQQHPARAEADVLQQAINYVFTGSIDPKDSPEITDRKSCVVVVADPKWKRFIRYHLRRLGLDDPAYRQHLFRAAGALSTGRSERSGRRGISRPRQDHGGQRLQIRANRLARQTSTRRKRRFSS